MKVAQAVTPWAGTAVLLPEHWSEPEQREEHVKLSGRAKEQELGHGMELELEHGTELEHGKRRMKWRNGLGVAF